MSHPLHFLILTVAGWLQRRLEAQIEYLIAENAAYKQRPGDAGLRFTDRSGFRPTLENRMVSVRF
jgi:hypothetical protein